MARIARALGADSAPAGVYDLAKALGARIALRDIGMPEAGLDRAAELTTTNAYWNPRPLERGAIRQLLQQAWEGERPH
jgi:alcohol dehydrogenase class IV